MVVGIPKEIVTGEKRVSVVPGIISRLKGISVVMERGAGEAAGFPDTAYVEQGVSIVDTSALYEQSDIILKIQTPTATEARLFKEGTTLISFLYPLTNTCRPAGKRLGHESHTTKQSGTVDGCPFFPSDNIGL